MHFIHGSSATPAEPKDFKFQLFDHIYDPNNRGSHAHINSGLDQYGPGAYAFGSLEGAPVHPKLMHEAQRHAGKDGEGSVLGFSVDMGDELVFANHWDADEISVEEWVVAIEATLVERLRLADYYPDDFETKIRSAISQWEEGEKPSEALLLDAFSEINETELPEGMELDNMDGPEDLEAAFEEYAYGEMEINSPVSQFYDEHGSPEGLAKYAISKSDNLWETLQAIYEGVAVSQGGMGYESFNKAFHHAVINSVDDVEKIKVASVEGGSFFVIFDIDAVEMEYARVLKSELDPVRMEAALDTVVANNKTYYHDLEPGQMQNMHKQTMRDELGSNIDDDTARQLANLRTAPSAWSGLKSDIIRQAGQLKESEWFSNDHARDVFEPATRGFEEDETPNLRRSRSN
jgi:hypothetical protein